jgi:hypothetical protein
MKSIFNDDSYNELLNRIERLNKDTTPEWGKMSVGQMVWHCQGPLNIILEKNDYGMKPSLLAKLFFKKSLYNDKAWRKGLPTAKFLKTKESKEFDKEKDVLVSLMNELFTQRNKEEWKAHPAFGYFTKDQWGQMQYKHLDHHLRQFGV